MYVLSPEYKVSDKLAPIGKPVKVWLEDKTDLEKSCLEQIVNLSNLPFIHSHLAVMPDTHKGYGMVIGGVMGTIDVIIPNAVGVDIGCGMIAVKLSGITMDEIMSRREEIVHQILRAIPTGKYHRKSPLMSANKLHDMLFDKVSCTNEAPTPVMDEQNKANRIANQLGTLGGGNHFIEIQKDQTNQPWIMIHSGSRNFGKQVADYYNKVAKDLNKKYHSKVPPEWDLAFLPRGTQVFDMYWREMHLALEFALMNRNCMLEEAVKAIENLFDKYVRQEEYINIHHNYASIENHFGKNVYIHRKGATLAKKDTVGIIPGSMGTKSYIVKGKGSRNSFHSCSHGAGRVLGRKAAKKKYTREEVLKYYSDLGIVIGKTNMKDVAEECDWAYKSIENVMENQKDLVKILHELTPVAVVKG